MEDSFAWQSLGAAGERTVSQPMKRCWLSFHLSSSLLQQLSIRGISHVLCHWGVWPQTQCASVHSTMISSQGVRLSTTYNALSAYFSKLTSQLCP